MGAAVYFVVAAAAGDGSDQVRRLDSGTAQPSQSDMCQNGRFRIAIAYAGDPHLTFAAACRFA
jgi:hypothetical protein